MTDTAELKRLLAAATPGEWEAKFDGTIDRIPVSVRQGPGRAPVKLQHPQNVHLIVALRNAAPALIEEVDRHRAGAFFNDWQIAMKEASIARKEADALRARLEKVEGWRENDWPEWFDRRTAEAVADLALAPEVKHRPECAVNNPFAGPDGGGGACDCAPEVKPLDSLVTDTHHDWEKP